MTSAARRACAVGTTVALVGLTTGLGIMSATAASVVEPINSTQTAVSQETPAPADDGSGLCSSDAGSRADLRPDWCGAAGSGPELEGLVTAQHE
jgi:hypothetical protein